VKEIEKGIGHKMSAGLRKQLETEMDTNSRAEGEALRQEAMRAEMESKLQMERQAAAISMI
jgi:hypothetical protein